MDKTLRGWLVVLLLAVASGWAGAQDAVVAYRDGCGCPSGYDMRGDLTPRRVTVAMWDYSWLYCHYEGGPFEDWDRVLDELVARGFNTVRIDAFPMIVHGLREQGRTTLHGAADPWATWGPHPELTYEPEPKLREFMRITKQKGVYVILSTWGGGRGPQYEDRATFWQAWETVLDLLADENLLDHVLYVDFDQEFPYFSPFQATLNALAGKQDETPVTDLQAMEAAGRPGARWNAAQMAFVKDYFNSTLRHFQEKYPYLRFTFSLTNFWEDVRALKITDLDVLELHFWIDDSRFSRRTDWEKVPKNRNPEHSYAEYNRQILDTMRAVRPMMLKNMDNRLRYACEWSQEIGAPVVTTEAWGPWWHMDHPDLDWQWLYDWCEASMDIAGRRGLWGITPWNFSHPYWENWSNVAWYRRVNERFLQSP